MKAPSTVSARLCIAAGVLLVGDVLLSHMWHIEPPIGPADRLDIFSLAIGIYFIGKGLFIEEILSVLPSLKQNR